MSSATANSECNLPLLWLTAFKQRSVALPAWRRAAFAAAGVVVYHEPTERNRRAASARLHDMGKKFRDQGQHLKQVEWRTAFELPSREARAADLVIVGARHTGGNVHDLVDPGMILLRAGRPVLVVPDTVAPLQLRRVVVAWKNTRECRRAVRDALAFLQQAKEVLLVAIGEGESESSAKRTSFRRRRLPSPPSSRRGARHLAARAGASRRRTPASRSG